MQKKLRNHRGSILGIGILYLAGFLCLIAAFILCQNQPLKKYWLGADQIIAGVESAKAAGAFFLGGLVALSGGYIWLLRHTHQELRTVDERHVRIFLVAVIVLFVALPPFLSTDVFNYLQQGWVFSHQHANPYESPVNTFSDYPLRDLTRGYNEYIATPYGPLWTLTAALISRASNGSLWPALLLFKLVNTLAAFGMLFLISRIVRRWFVHQELTAMVFFAANPLVLLEIPGNAHNATPALFALLLGLWWFTRSDSRRWIGLVFMMTAVFFKATAAVGLLCSMYWFLRFGGRLRDSLMGISKAAGTGVLIFLAAGFPFLSQKSNIPMLFGAAQAYLPYRLECVPVNLTSKFLLKISQQLGLPISPQSLSAVVITVFVLLSIAFAVWITERNKTLRGIAPKLGAIYAVVTLTMLYWRPWFVIWPLAFAALEPDSSWSKVIAIYSLLAMATYLVTCSSGIAFFCLRELI